MIVLLRQKVSTIEMQQMQETYAGFIKLAVDIRRKMLTGGGEMHSDCESVLLEDGSLQEDIWGANWYPSEQRVEFESLINIRPAQGNRSIIIQSEELCQKIEQIVVDLLGGVA